MRHLLERVTPVLGSLNFGRTVRASLAVGRKSYRLLRLLLVREEE